MSVVYQIQTWVRCRHPVAIPADETPVLRTGITYELEKVISTQDFTMAHAIMKSVLGCARTM